MAKQHWWHSHVFAMQRNRPGTILLLLFSLAMGVGVWFGTLILDAGLRIFLVILAIVTMLFCGIGYLFPGEDEAPPDS
jgi:hypothetical protein